jgi:hypothetical protein
MFIADIGSCNFHPDVLFYQILGLSILMTYRYIMHVVTTYWFDEYYFRYGSVSQWTISKL